MDSKKDYPPSSSASAPPPPYSETDKTAIPLCPNLISNIFDTVKQDMAHNTSRLFGVDKTRSRDALDPDGLQRYCRIVVDTVYDGIIIGGLQYGPALSGDTFRKWNKDRPFRGPVLAALKFDKKRTVAPSQESIIHAILAFLTLLFKEREHGFGGTKREISGIAKSASRYHTALYESVYIEPNKEKHFSGDSDGRYKYISRVVGIVGAREAGGRMVGPTLNLSDVDDVNVLLDVLETLRLVLVQIMRMKKGRIPENLQ